MEQQRIIISLFVLLVVSAVANAFFYFRYKKKITEKEQSDKYFEDFISCIHPPELINLMEKKIDLIIGSRKMQKSLTQVLITKLEDYFILKEEISLGNIGLALIHVRDINNEFLKNFSSTCCQQAIRQIYINERDKLVYSFVTSIQQNEHSWVREKILTTLATPDRIHLADCINEEIKERIEGVGIDENQRTCLQLGILTVVKKDSAVLI